MYSVFRLLLLNIYLWRPSQGSVRRGGGLLASMSFRETKLYVAVGPRGGCQDAPEDSGCPLTSLSCTHRNPPAHQGHLNRSHPLTSLLPHRYHPDLGPPASCLRAHGSPYLAFLPQPCPLHHLPPLRT